MAASNKPPKNDFAPAWLRLPETPPSPLAVNNKTSNGRDRKLETQGFYSVTGYGYQRHYSYDHCSENGDGRSVYGYESHFGVDKRPNGIYHRPQVRDGGKQLVKGTRNGSVGSYDYFDDADMYITEESYGGQLWLEHGASRKAKPALGDAETIGSQNNNNSNNGNRPRDEVRSKSISVGHGNGMGNERKPTRRGEEEFPSLSRDNDTGKQASGAGAWEKPHEIIRMPPHSPQSAHQQQSSVPASPGGWATIDGCAAVKKDATSSSQQSTNPSLYKAFIPSKAILTRKSSRDVIKTGKESTNGSNGHSSSVTSNGPLTTTKSPPAVPRVTAVEPTVTGGMNGLSSTPPKPIAIVLNVTQPKNKKLGDKKSDFLRQLKMGSEDSNGSGTTDIGSSKTHNGLTKSLDENEDASGGRNDCAVSATTGAMEIFKIEEPDEMILSSSLEAEHRLLREMGWDEGATDVSEITEEERREFERQLQQKRLQKTSKGRLLSRKLDNGPCDSDDDSDTDSDASI